MPETTLNGDIHPVEIQLRHNPNASTEQEPNLQYNQPRPAGRPRNQQATDSKTNRKAALRKWWPSHPSSLLLCVLCWFSTLTKFFSDGLNFILCGLPGFMCSSKIFQTFSSSWCLFCSKIISASSPIFVNCRRLSGKSILLFLST